MLAFGFGPEVSMHLAKVQSLLANTAKFYRNVSIIRDLARAVSPNM
jgi:hypothetical protein